MNVYKIELLVCDFDNLGEEQIRCVIENTHYPNHCISPSVMDVAERSVKWSDAHPLNHRSTQADEFRRMFAPSTATPKE